jgi:hypothetical protein
LNFHACGPRDDPRSSPRISRDHDVEVVLVARERRHEAACDRPRFGEDLVVGGVTDDVA